MLDLQEGILLLILYIASLHLQLCQNFQVSTFHTRETHRCQNSVETLALWYRSANGTLLPMLHMLRRSHPESF